MNTEIDIGQLAVHRDGSRNKSASEEPAVQRHLLTRYFLPGMFVLGFLFLAGWAASDVLIPSKKVTVMPVITGETTRSNVGVPLFTAAGWVEPRPSPILITSLATGTIETLFVVEGQAVDANDPIAKLIDVDIRIRLKEAESDIAYQEAKLAAARAQLIAARTNLDQPTHLEAALARTQSELVEAEIQVANLPFEIKGAESQLNLTKKNLDQKTRAEQVVSGSVLQQAHADFEKAKAAYDQLIALDPLLTDRVDALRRQYDALNRQLKLKSAEHLAFAEAETSEKAALAQLQRAKLAFDTTKLQLDRMTVSAPMAGNILDVVARQGTQVTGMPGDSQFGSNIVATMYNPKQLQIRADVRLEDLPKVAKDQEVIIETASLEKPISGRILQVTSAANIQKNTLEVKVAVIDPPDILKPEMLVQLTFLGFQNTDDSKPKDPKPSFFVPQQLVGSSDNGKFLWVADQDARVARQVAVKTTGRADADGLVEITDGITMSSRLIVGGRETLQDGDRIEINGEDSTFGMNQMSGRSQNQEQQNPPNANR